MYCEDKKKRGIISGISALFTEPSSCPLVWPLTDVTAGHDVAPVHRRLKVVILVVDLEPPDAADHAGVETEEAADVLHLPHAAHIERLVECYPREQALVIKDLISGIKWNLFMRSRCLPSNENATFEEFQWELFDLSPDLNWKFIHLNCNNKICAMR